MLYHKKSVALTCSPNLKQVGDFGQDPLKQLFPEEENVDAT